MTAGLSVLKVGNKARRRTRGQRQIGLVEPEVFPSLPDDVANVFGSHHFLTYCYRSVTIQGIHGKINALLPNGNTSAVTACFARHIMDEG